MYGQSTLSPNDTRFRFAFIMLWITLGFGLVNLISDIAEYQLIVGILNLNFSSILAAEDSDKRQLIITIISILIYLVTIVGFLMWLQRAYANLEIGTKRAGQQILKYSNGWAVGAWFVPILSLFRPFQIIKEMFDATYQYIKYFRAGTLAPYKIGVLGAWWGLWLAANVASNVSLQMKITAEKDPGNMLTSSMIGIVADILFLPACLLLLKVVSDYNKMEKQLHEIDLERQNSPAPPPIPGARIDGQTGAAPFPPPLPNEKPLFPEDV